MMSPNSSKETSTVRILSKDPCDVCLNPVSCSLKVILVLKIWSGGRKSDFMELMDRTESSKSTRIAGSSSVSRVSTEMVGV
jgi:hypothetical protein